MMENYTVKAFDDRTIWIQNGKLHRLDGPAAIYNNGTEFWFQNGKRHRLDGPAIEWADGTEFWLQNDKFHRIGGPAIERADGSVEYWEKGKRIPDPKKTKEMTVAEICEQLGYNVKVVK